MPNEEFMVKNVKCGGCVQNIQTQLGALPGVSAVEVTIESGKVVVSGPALDRATLAAKLQEIGYPAA